MALKRVVGRGEEKIIAKSTVVPNLLMPYLVFSFSPTPISLVPEPLHVVCLCVWGWVEVVREFISKV
jgi:hypothetical protein